VAREISNKVSIIGPELKIPDEEGNPFARHEGFAYFIDTTK
jgi:hypothetical protein